MHDQPSTELMHLLGQLGLAGAADLQRVHRRAVRLVRGIPLFDSVWIDALVQDSALSLFQAGLLHAGRGKELLVGDFVLVDRVVSLGAITTYQARHRETGKPVRLIIANFDDEESAMQSRLTDLLERSKRIHCPHVAPVWYAQTAGQQAIVAGDWIAGESLATRLVHSGRFGAIQVQSIARQIVTGLRSLDVAGLVHGNLSLRDVLLTDAGDAVLAAPGLLPCLRPEVGYSFADLQPEAYATVAPERIRNSRAVQRTDDFYALGVVCWHLLAGRSPFPIANSLATLRAIERGRIPDITKIAIDVPASLAQAIHACLRPNPEQRPQSFAELDKLLAEPRSASQRSNARSAAATLLTRRATHSTNPHRTSLPRPAIGALAALLIVLALLFGLRQRLEKPVPTPNLAVNTATDISPVPPEHGADDGVGHQTVDRDGDSSAVVRASYTAKVEGPPDLLLPTDRPLYLKSISPRTGQRVAGQSSQRSQIWLTKGPLEIVVEDVHFQGVDFVWAPADNSDPFDAAIRLLSNRIKFTDCSFQTHGDLSPLPAIVKTIESPEAEPLGLPTVACEFENCVAINVDCLVAHARQEALSVQLSEVLALRMGSAVRLDVPPDRQSPLNVTLSRCTLRDVRSCLSLPSADSASPGRLSIQSEHCVFAPTEGGALIRLNGPDGWRWLREVEWRGQASIVDQHAQLVAGDSSQATERQLQITGLVRSQIEFAGPLATDLSHSQVIGWSAPLLSPDPPGANPTLLTLPSLVAAKPSTQNLTPPQE